MPNRTFTLLARSSVLVFVLLLICAFAAAAQSEIRSEIDQIESANFPEVEALVSVYDEQGYVVKDVTPENFSATEDSQPVANLLAASIYEHPLEIVLVIDASQSMGYGEKPTPIENINTMLKAFVASLAAADQVAVVSFSDQVVVLQNLTPDKNLVNLALDAIRLKGNNKAYDGLMQAINLLQGRSKRPVIILVSDSADAGASQATLDQVSSAALDHSIVIHPVVWGGAKANIWQPLAGVTHGEFSRLGDSYPDARAIQTAFNTIQASLPADRLQHTLKFTSSLPADGLEHELLMRVDHLGRTIETVGHFLAPAGAVVVSLPDYSTGQVIGGNVQFAPKIESPAPVDRLDILVDGQPLTSVSNPPYEYTWDATNIPFGEHEFSFVATDSAGNTGQTSLRLAVQPPIEVAIINPVGGANLGGPVVIEAQVTALSKVAQVEFLVDGKSVAILPAEPYQYTWNTLNASAGAHEITVRASDINGFAAENIVRVNVGETSGGMGNLGLILAAALGVLVLVVPLGLRARKGFRSRKNLEPLPSLEGKPALSYPAGRATLVEAQGLNPGQVWSLSPSSEIRLGRKRDENDIPLQGATASRRHALIRFQEGQYYLYNLKPENPLLVNGQSIAQQQILYSGDTIQAGESVFQFQVQG